MNKITKRGIIAFSLLLLMCILSGVILYRMEYAWHQEKELRQDRIKLNSVAEMMDRVDETQEAAAQFYETQMQNNLRFMTQMLKEDHTQEGSYTGPRRFTDGAVVELDGEKVIWPEDMPTDFPKLSADQIRQGDRYQAVIGGENGEGTKVIITPAKVAENVYYVDWTAEREILDDQYSELRNEDFLKAAEQSFNGNLLMVSLDEDELPLLCETVAYPDTDHAVDLGFSRETIAEQRLDMQVNGEACLCVYQALESQNAELIYIKPKQAMVEQSMLHAGTVAARMFIILATILFYVLSVYRYVAGGSLPEQKAWKYQPANLRRTVIMAGGVGAIIIFLFSLTFRTLDELHEDNIVDAGSVGGLFEQLQSTAARRTAYENDQEANWYIYHGKHMAGRIAEHPEAGSAEKLQEYCRIFGIDFITLYDADGNEEASSADYTGMTMDTGLGENSEDFRRLLRGVEYVVHGSSVDSMTGLNRQYIGVPVAMEKNGKKAHGALVMAMIPRELRADNTDIGEQIGVLKTGERINFFADSQTGEILYSSDPSLLKKTVSEIGLSEAGIQEGYTDFAEINGERSYVTSVKQGNGVFYYIVTNHILFSRSIPLAVSAVICYLVIFATVAIACLAGRRSETGTLLPAGTLRRNPAPESGNDDEEEEEITRRDYSELLVSKSPADRRAERKTPEDRTSAILKLDLFILVLVQIILTLNQRGSVGGNGTLTSFILAGRWMRGLNLFAICGSIMVMGFSAAIIVTSNGVLSLIAGFSNRHVGTGCRLLYSLIRYVTIIISLYYMFDYFGLPISTYVASLSVISLAISIGSKDMVSDILAGLLIIFERQYQVGDYVEIDNQRGKVLEIGVRSTKLLTENNDIRYINNSNIRSIVNKSKKNSFVNLDISVSTPLRLEELEEAVNRGLKQIGEQSELIFSGPTLVAVTGMSGGSADKAKNFSVQINCICAERNRDRVLNDLRREIILFCEQEGIDLHIGGMDYGGRGSYTR